MMFGASEATIPYALEYMNIYVLGTVFELMATGLNSFITTQGYAKTGMISIAIGAVINIVLDPIFMFVFDMGIKGAAWATVISQAISAIWVLHFLTGKKTKLKIKRKHIKLEKTVLLPIFALGLAPFLMRFTESVVTIVLNKSLLTHGGDTAVGVNTILTSAMQFLFLPLMGIAQGAQPILSYNYGARNKERVEKSFKYLLISACVFSTILWLFFMVAPRLFASIFTLDREIVEMSTWALRVYMMGGLFLGVQVACQQSFIALGNARTSVFLAVLRKVFLLIPLIIILPKMFSNKVFAVFLSEPIADAIAAIITFVLFRKEFSELMVQMPSKKEIEDQIVSSKLVEDIQ